MYLAILEDNAKRREHMARLAADRLSTYEQAFFTSSAAMIEWLQANLSQVIGISLDHDLEPDPDASGPWVDPGTGREVADHLATCQATCPIVIHSTNVSAAMGMQATLEETGWLVDRITPYEDVLWISELWLPTVRKSIAGFTVTPATPRVHRETA